MPAPAKLRQVQLQVIPEDVKRCLIEDCAQTNRSLNDAILTILGIEFGVDVTLTGRPFGGATTDRNTLLRRIPAPLYRKIGHKAVDGRSGYANLGTDEREVVIETLRRYYADRLAAVA